MNKVGNILVNKHGQPLHHYPIYLPVELVKALKCQAAASGETVARIMRRALAAGLPIIAAAPPDGEEETPNGM